MAKKMVECRSCGEDIAKSAKTCPHCGAKNKKPIYKRWWFWLIIVIVIGSLGADDSESDSSASKSNSASTQKEEVEQDPDISYTPYTVSQMVDDLSRNALSAEEKYDNQYVEIFGSLSVVDSDGKYISLTPADNEWIIQGVQCYLKTEEHKDAVRNLSVGDNVTLTGKITSVGEVLGYILDIHDFIG